MQEKINVSRENLTGYRNKEIEKERTASLKSLIPEISSGNSLDVGTRDGWFSVILTEKFDKVTALDLEMPAINNPKVTPVKGDASNLVFDDDTFDLVFCAEVLEHIPSALLQKVCDELVRVSKKYIIVGVPYKQDTRICRTRCFTCGGINPPWGHVNSFNETKLQSLFPSCLVKKMEFVGNNNEYTNFLSEFFMDLADNPYGPYYQEEPCIHCGAKLVSPPQRNFFQKISTKIGFYLRLLQKPFIRSHPNWIHILFEKKN